MIKYKYVCNFWFYVVCVCCFRFNFVYVRFSVFVNYIGNVLMLLLCWYGKKKKKYSFMIEKDMKRLKVFEISF